MTLLLKNLNEYKGNRWDKINKSVNISHTHDSETDEDSMVNYFNKYNYKEKI